jgi:hypothetical protein
MVVLSVGCRVIKLASWKARPPQEGWKAESIGFIMKKGLLVKFLLGFLISFITISEGIAQEEHAGIDFLIDRSVINADDPDEQEIIELWKGYITSDEYKNRDSIYWSFDKMAVPDYFLWPLGMGNLRSRTPKVQCKVIGVFPVKNGYYNLKSSFSHVDKDGIAHLDGIVSIYAKKFDGTYLLVNSSQYFSEIWRKEQVGNITYYVHPEHEFNRKEAERMSAFNLEMARKFKVKPIQFEYFVTNYARQIVRLWGHDYMPKMYIPAQSGGVADIDNKIVYSGNNSEYYPHEVVHLYTYEKVTTRTHFWIQEGIATYFAGSGGKDFDWHLNELKTFLQQNPVFRLNDLNELNVYIPNGKHMTDFRYVIGGLIAREIYNKRGIQGLVSILKTGPSNTEFFRMIKVKLGVERNEFENYIRKLATQ